MRISKTGASRNVDTGKMDYVHESAMVRRIMAEYMHKNRHTPLGMREADNWKLGLGLDTYHKSLRGHFQDFYSIMEGHKVLEKGEEITPFDALCAVKFNLEGIIHEIMRGWEIDRLYTDGKLEVEFNNRYKQYQDDLSKRKNNRQVPRKDSK
jgi:hypothetical protein